MKRFLCLLLSSLLVTTNLFGINKSDIDRAKLGYSTMPVGSIIQSVLTVAQFQAINGTDWVPMEGQGLGSQGSSGKAICDTYAICTLPDARNRYLRSAGTGDANLRVAQEDATAVNGLANSSSSISGTATSQAYSGSPTSSSDSHYHYMFGSSTGSPGAVASYQQNTVSHRRIGGSLPEYDYVMYAATDASYQGRSGTDTHTHTTNIGHTHPNSPLSGTAAAQSLSGDSETRPATLVVNTFVKIN